ncbi:MAG TPA: ATP-binding cassette domain-containing protein [Pseudomonadales bacterium]
MVSTALLQAHGVLPCFEEPQDVSSASGIDLALMPASITAVMGENPSQVSTWLRCLAGLEDPCAGQVRVAGHNLSRLSKADWQRMRTRIAYLNRDSSLLSVLSMLDNIVQPALYHKLAERDELVARARALLDEIGPLDPALLQQLPAYLDPRSYAQALLARALLLQPQILILDDFFGHYDKNTSAALLQYVFGKVEQQGMAALVYDHDMELLTNKCSASLFIDGHRLLQFTSREALLAAADPQVNAFLRNHDVAAYGR